MRFDSASFLFFFLAVLVLHRLLPWRRSLLILASYAFYASWNPPFLLLLLGSTTLDYQIGRRLGATDEPARRKLLVSASVVLNLAVLALFKYANFFLDQVAALGLVGAAELEPLYISTQIPLGISFYTFQTISYSIDVYRRHVEPCRSVGDFALFVAFFPQLLAGPVVRAGHFIPQIARNRPADEEQVLDGIELCLVGLFKKVVLADTFALLVDRCYADPEAYSSGALVIASYGFMVQMYCDFSGYSTMARGLGKLLGFELPRNFFFPALAPNPVAYRKAWHITMGDWFRDYFYRPLGGDRRGTLRAAFNTMVSWSAFGFWHGASWNFLLWGVYQGVILVIYRVAKLQGWLPRPSRFSAFVGYAIMPPLWGLSIVLFRAETLGHGWRILERIFSFVPGEVSISPRWGIALLVLYAWHWANKLWYRERTLASVGWPMRVSLIVLVLAVLALFAGSGAPFYYFQF